MGDSEGQRGLGILYEDGRGVKSQNDAKAAHWFTKAAEQGDSDAQCRLAALLFQGLSVNRSSLLK